MSIHSGQPRSLSLHQTQPTVSAGQNLVVGAGGRSGRENLEWSHSCRSSQSCQDWLGVCFSKWTQEYAKHFTDLLPWHVLPWLIVYCTLYVHANWPFFFKKGVLIEYAELMCNNTFFKSYTYKVNTSSLRCHKFDAKIWKTGNFSEANNSPPLLHLLLRFASECVINVRQFSSLSVSRQTGRRARML